MADDISFDWDEANIDHIARHGVMPEEAQQVLENEPLELEPQFVNGEERFPTVGVTNAGRWLVIVVAEREGKARVVTAYPADSRLVALYVRERWGSH